MSFIKQRQALEKERRSLVENEMEEISKFETLLRDVNWSNFSIMHRFIDMECEYYIIMHNRWGRTVEPKPPARAPGQNYININFNFNAVKDKPSAIQGKKIDNFI